MCNCACMRRNWTISRFELLVTPNFSPKFPFVLPLNLHAILTIHSHSTSSTSSTPTPLPPLPPHPSVEICWPNRRPSRVSRFWGTFANWPFASTFWAIDPQRLSVTPPYLHLSLFLSSFLPSFLSSFQLLHPPHILLILLTLVVGNSVKFDIIKSYMFPKVLKGV